MGGGQVGTRREQNDVSVSVLGQDNWVGFDILWLRKLGPKYDQIFVKTLSIGRDLSSPNN